MTCAPITDASTKTATSKIHNIRNVNGGIADTGVRLALRGPPPVCARLAGAAAAAGVALGVVAGVGDAVGDAEVVGGLAVAHPAGGSELPLT